MSECLCVITAPDSFGNRDLIPQQECPLHAEGTCRFCGYPLNYDYGPPGNKWWCCNCGACDPPAPLSGNEGRLLGWYA